MGRIKLDFYKKIKLLAAVGAAVLFLLCTPVFGAVSWIDGQGTGTQQDPFIVTGLEDMQLLSQKVAAGTTFSGYYFELTKDIDMQGIQWTPIGSSSSKSFKGNFNGCGHTIKNMTVNDTTGYAGLFGSAGAKAVICHIRLEGGSVCTTGSYAGGIVGYVYSTSKSQIYDCINISCNVTTTSSSGYIGGIAGYNKGSYLIMEYCENYADIYPTGTTCSYAGGIVGYAKGYSGTALARIINCHNYGNIGIDDNGSIYTGSSGAGGIVGYYNTNVYTYNCANHGNIKGCSGYTGGIAGRGLGSSSIGCCFNDGLVESTKKAGGIIGYLTDSVYLSCSTVMPVTEDVCGSIVGGTSSSTGATAIIYYCYSTAEGELIGSNGGNEPKYSGVKSSFADVAAAINSNLSATAKFKNLKGFTGETEKPFLPETVEISLYEDDDATVTNTVTVEEGALYEGLYTPQKAGYVFAGWYTTTGGQYKIDSNTRVALSWENTEGRSLYARWIEGGAAVTMGDVNGDLKADKIDAAYILKLVCGSDTGNADFSNADANSDGAVDIRDAVEVLK